MGLYCWRKAQTGGRDKGFRTHDFTASDDDRRDRNFADVEMVRCND